MMQFSQGEWWLVVLLAGIAISVIAFFLKRTMSRVDSHDTDINLIKQTYVTKDEFKELRTEIKADLDKVTESVDKLKDTTLSRQDFYRAQAETNDNIKRIYDMLLKSRGGASNE